MPLIQINMAKGRTEEQKRALLAAITEAVHASIDAPLTSIPVWIAEFEPTEFMAGGSRLDGSDRALNRRDRNARDRQHPPCHGRCCRRRERALVLGVFDMAEQLAGSNLVADLATEGIGAARRSWSTTVETSRDSLARL